MGAGGRVGAGAGDCVATATGAGGWVAGGAGVGAGAGCEQAAASAVIATNAKTRNTLMDTPSLSVSVAVRSSGLPMAHRDGDTLVSACPLRQEQGRTRFNTRLVELPGPQAALGDKHVRHRWAFPPDSARDPFR